MSNVQIKVESAGVNFACYATVESSEGHLHSTRDYPHGYRQQAYQAALRWALSGGYTVDGDDTVPVRIDVRESNLGCTAAVIDTRTGRTLRTEEMGWGFGHNARAAAEAWADQQGYMIIDETGA